MIGAIDIFRISSGCKKLGVSFVHQLLDYVVRLLFACWVPHAANIGPGVARGYGGLGIIIHKDPIMEAECHIDQCVTIGGNARESGVPKIGCPVYIGAGAKILGKITVGTL